MATSQSREGGVTEASAVAPASATAASPLPAFDRILGRGPFHRVVALFGGTMFRSSPMRSAIVVVQSLLSVSLVEEVENTRRLQRPETAVFEH
jgi:hypothetical protein